MSAATTLQTAWIHWFVSVTGVGVLTHTQVTQWVSMRVKEAILLGNTLVVDGYPRTKYQLNHLPKTCSNQRFYTISLDKVSIEESVRRTLQRQWTPPHGSLPENDDETSGDYYVVTRADAEKRYRVYQSTISPETSESTISIDASVSASLVQSQAKHWLETLPSLLVALPKEPAVMQTASPLETAQVIQQTMQLACMRNNQQRRFIGSHPVSLQRCHFSALDNGNYLISRKWDGERQLLLLHAGHVWMLMRNFDVLKSRWAAEIATDDWDNSLLDVEWLPNSGTVCIIDCIAIGGENVGHRTLLQRLNQGRKLTKILPEIVPTIKQCRLQRYYSMADFRFVATTPVQSGGDRCDGFVFTAQDRPYHIGRDSNMFKFKPPEENTVDLMLFSGTDLYARADDESDNRMIKVGTLASVQTYPDGSVLECLLVNRAFKVRVVSRNRPTHTHPQDVEGCPSSHRPQ